MSEGYTIWYKPKESGWGKTVYWSDDKDLIDYLISFYKRILPGQVFWVSDKND